MKGLRYARSKLDLARLSIHNASRLTKIGTVGTASFQVEVDNGRELSRLNSYAVKEPDTVSWIAESVRPGDVFYDIGANIGLYTLYAAERLRGEGQVYSFEPESQNYASLNRNVHLNGYSDIVTTLCLAVTDATRVDSFFVHGHLRAGEAIHQFGEAVDDRGRPFAPVHRQGMIGVSLDDLCFEHGLSFPTHIKIDVDGHEGAVIQGAGRVLADPRLRSVLVEVTDTAEDTETTRGISATFEAAGFVAAGSSPTTGTGRAANFIFVRPATSSEPT